MLAELFPLKLGRNYLLVSMLSFLVGCGEVRYYAQSVSGHFDVLSRSEEIQHLIDEGLLATETSAKLQLVLKSREFATSILQLSINDSYTYYADLSRDYVVQNLFAAEEFSTELYSWCYPVIGCANYRGYFDQKMLNKDHDNLKSENYDTYVSKVTAYSTLGWFSDPVLNTFIALPEYRLVGLIFHELAHQQIYIQDDTNFNESFATAVAQAGLEQFYAQSDDANQLVRYREDQQLQNALIDIAVLARNKLDEIYQQSLPENTKRQQK
ncbi:MAG: putative aminopeptidase, partial [Halioglobus sp.]